MAPYIAEEYLTKPAPHHAGVKALWDTNWRKPCEMGIYPFGDGKLEDFEKIFDKLIELDLKEPYDPDIYAAPFFPVAEELLSKATSAEKGGNKDEASDLYLRAAAVYRIARFPINYSSGRSAEAWRRGRGAYLKAGPYFSPPLYGVAIPHTHGVGEEVGLEIPVCVRAPSRVSSSPVPVVLFICGLDGYRTDLTAFVSKHLDRGYAVVSVEIPGTGDCPVIKNDPKSPDRLWSSVLDWIDTQELFDNKKVIVRGVSTGGYYAMRIAHTHRARLLAVVSHGGGCHHMFDARWIEKQNTMEYPFALSDALAYKFGYENTTDYMKDSQKRFSLLESGLLDQPSAKLLLINGIDDNVFPIEDSMLPLQHGNIKEARFIPGSAHMGFPASENYIYDWIDGLFK